MRRYRALIVGLAAVVASSGVTWVVGRQIRSPAEIAAQTAPPTPSLVTVPVEKRTLVADVIVRGTVRFGSPQVVVLPSSNLKKGTSVVSTVPAKGGTVSEGTAPFVISGRPVLVLRGAIPAYRDLGPRTTGEDVRQLEAALARRGFPPGPLDGVYDGQTGDAVAAWYRKAGWEPLGPTEEQRAALRQAEADEYQGRADVLSAQEGVVTAKAELAAAQAKARDARAAAQSAPPEEKAAKDREAADADATVVRAQEALDVAQRKVDLAVARADAVAAATAELRDGLGTQVPADEVLFFPTLPLRVDDVPVKVGDQVSGPVMTVTNSQLAVDAAVSVDDAKLIRQGAPVAIAEPDLGVQAAGTVSQIADAPGTHGVDPQRFYLEVTPADVPPSLVGASVILTITVQSTEGEVLAVPVTALSVAADGTSRVQVQARDGSTRYVAVTPGLAAKGLVEVTPVDGDLAPGDLVVVGSGTPGGSRSPAGSPAPAPGTPTSTGVTGSPATPTSQTPTTGSATTVSTMTVSTMKGDPRAP